MALRALILLLALGFAALPAGAQQAATLFGRVSDEAGAPVAGVTLTLSAPDDASLRRAALTDTAGAYRLESLPAGRYLVRAARPGYRAVAPGEIRLAAGESRRYDVRLVLDTLRVEGIVVTSRRDTDRERSRFETEPGVTARVVTGESLKTLPGLAEADVLRAIELLPGVISTSDFSSAFNVRGGSADQNLIQLDGFPIFNPFHLGGLFSVFNADAVARAELLAGGFGAEYGGRVSSVLNVESEPGQEEGMEIEGGVSLLAARLLVRADLPWEGGRWFLSARRSYFDQILRPIADFPYHLTDLQGFATTATRGGGRVSFTGYLGDDVLDLSDFESSSAEPGDSSSILRIRWKWGNRVAGARWEQPLRGGWFADTRLGFTSFSDELGFVDFDDVRFSSRIEQLSLHTDLARELSPGRTLQLGGALQRIDYANLARAGGATFFSSSDHGLLAAGYGSFRWQPGDRWIVEPGLRLDSWHAGGATHTLLSPRFAAKRFLGAERDAAVKLALGRYTQFLHSLRNEELPVSNDTWVLADESIPPVVSDQVQLGVEKYWGERWSASAEAYFRNFRGVTEFNIADDPNDPSDDLLDGTGRSYGVDFLLRRSEGRLTGWTTVSFLHAERTLPDPLAAGWDDLPPTVTFPPIYDRRADVDIVAQYEFPGGAELGLRWNYGSPLPYTRPTGQYYAWRHNPIWGQFEPGDSFDDEPPLFITLGPRNGERYPAYHRLDATLRRTFTRGWGSWTPYLQLLNVYNRKNVLFYFYRYDRLPPTRSGISMFPVLPAIGVDFAF